MALDLVAKRARPDTFARWMSGGKIRPYNYQRTIGRAIARAIAGGNGRLIVNCPPRYGKSEETDFWTPTWLLDNDPSKRVILGCYGAELAERYGGRVRNEFEQNPRLLTRLREDSKAKNRWDTPEGGGMLALGLGGGVMGFGADVIIVDDPYKSWADAKSPRVRRSVVDWVINTLYYRLEPRGSIIVVMQRMDNDDLTGTLIKEHDDDWQIISLPALAVERDPMGREVGEPLCPDRYPLDQVLAKKRVSPRILWDTCQQQAPPATGGGEVYYNYTQAGNLDDGAMTMRRDLNAVAAFDFNVNPGMHVEIGQYDERADRFDVRHEVHGPRMKTEAAVEAMVAMLTEDGTRPFTHPLLEIYGDASGNSESTKAAESDYQIIARVLESAGIPFVMYVGTRNPAIKDRITAVNDALAGHVRIHTDCTRLIEDMEGQKEDDDGFPDKSDQLLGHSADAFGYWCEWRRPVASPMNDADAPAGIAR